MFIRVWNDNAIMCDLRISPDGTGTWTTRPEMPNNSNEKPDIEINPWKRYIKTPGQDVEEYGSGNLELIDQLKGYLNVALNAQCGCLNDKLPIDIALAVE